MNFSVFQLKVFAMTGNLILRLFAWLRVSFDKRSSVIGTELKIRGKLRSLYLSIISGGVEMLHLTRPKKASF